MMVCPKSEEPQKKCPLIFFRERMEIFAAFKHIFFANDLFHAFFFAAICLQCFFDVI